MTIATTGTTTLDRLPIGSQARVTGIDDKTGNADRLMEMGLLVGRPVEVARVAPFGDPIQIKVMGYHLSLRSTVARGIAVEIENASTTS